MTKKIIITTITLILSVFNLLAQQTGTLTDVRDGKTYKTVKIGEQWWMAENLAYRAPNWCWAYDNDSTNIDKYGFLYNWETANNVCPEGWHLPTRAEFVELLNNYGGETDREANYLPLITGGESGFNALLCGSMWFDGSFDEKDKAVNFWSSSPGRSLNDYNSSYSTCLYICTGKAILSASRNANFHSVRCVKNKY